MALAFCSPYAHSQCLPLATLTEKMEQGQVSPETMKLYLPVGEWEMHAGATAGLTYWTCLIAPATADETKAKPETCLELRRPNQQPLYDVVYKTTVKSCFSDLRAELRRAKIKVEPLTCVQCEAELFTAATYTVTTYDQQVNFATGKVPYPFVLIVHSLAKAPPRAD